MMPSASTTAAWRDSTPLSTIWARSSSGVEKDIVQFANLLFHIARHGQIHDEDRAVSAGLDGALNHAQSDDGQGAGRAGNDDVVVPAEYSGSSSSRMVSPH
jgi:hypothetical protein